MAEAAAVKAATVKTAVVEAAAAVKTTCAVKAEKKVEN